jgi:hypothetical protein
VTQHTAYKKPRLSHRFRFSLLHQWITENFKPSRAADIGGGKGVLAYLLNQSGYESTVIDPFDQVLPRAFKDISKKRTVLKGDDRAQVKRITAPFEIEMAKDFDLLIGLHTHGSNMKIIDAAQKYGISFVLLPCCVIDEPITVMPNVNWFDSLVDYAKSKGHAVGIAELNFAGQNRIMFSKAPSLVQR